jgi:hypothetical protein
MIGSLMPVANPKENTIEAALVKSVEAIGGIAAKMTSPGRRGFPDRILFLPDARIVVVEVKRPKGGRVSKHQMQWLHSLQELGVEIAIVRNERDIAQLL